MASGLGGVDAHTTISEAEEAVSSGAAGAGAAEEAEAADTPSDAAAAVAERTNHACVDGVLRHLLWRDCVREMLWPHRILPLPPLPELFC